MEVNPEFLFSWILFHLVSWEMDEKFSFWPNTHTHTHTHTHTPLYKASPIEGWRIMRKGHIFNICQMTEHPTAHVSVFKYPFSHSLSTISFEEASHHPFVMSYPAPCPRSQSLDFLDCPLNSSPQLFLWECRVVPPSRPCPYMHGGARHTQQHHRYTDPFPPDNGVAHITVPSHSTHFP